MGVGIWQMNLEKLINHSCIYLCLFFANYPLCASLSKQYLVDHVTLVIAYKYWTDGLARFTCLKSFMMKLFLFALLVCQYLGTVQSCFSCTGTTAATCASPCYKCGFCSTKCCRKFILMCLDTSMNWFACLLAENLFGRDLKQNDTAYAIEKMPDADERFILPCLSGRFSDVKREEDSGESTARLYYLHKTIYLQFWRLLSKKPFMSATMTATEGCLGMKFPNAGTSTEASWVYLKSPHWTISKRATWTVMAFFSMKSGCNGHQTSTSTSPYYSHSNCP